MAKFIQKQYTTDTWQLGDDAWITCDTSGNATIKGTLTVNNGTTAEGVSSVGFEKLSSTVGGVAVAVDKQVTILTSTGTHAGTLADGVAVGDIKEIYMVVDGGDFTLTPANFANGTTIVFADAGDYIKLIFDGTDWNILHNSGCTIGA
jgi:hypothetical protein